jgi:uncharacterized protein (DUF1499 family)
VSPSRKKRMIYIVMVVIILLMPVVFLAAQSVLAQRPANLGVHNGRLADCPRSPNCVCTQCTDAQHQIDPIAFDGSPAEAVQRIKTALTTLPRMKTITETDNYLHVESTSLIFRFTDDVEFFVDNDAKKIQFRSASRAGYSDLGANRSRMERIRAAFQEGK